MLDLFQYEFFTNALWAAVFTSISCGIIGTYIVCRRMVFVSGGISHASFGGIGLGYYLGIDPVLGAIAFSIFSALGIEMVSKKSEIREDSMIGIFWAMGMASGILFIHLTPGYATNLSSYLFGNILTVGRFDLYLMAALNLLIIGVFSLLFKEIVFISFDEEFARAQKMRVNLINSVLLCLVALTIVLHIRIVGIILVISLVTVPQAIANLFSKNFRHLIFYSIGFGFISAIGGLFLSYKLQVPSGACIIFSSLLLLLCLKGMMLGYKALKIRKNLGITT